MWTAERRSVDGLSLGLRFATQDTLILFFVAARALGPLSVSLLCEAMPGLAVGGALRPSVGKHNTPVIDLGPIGHFIYNIHGGRCTQHVGDL